MRSHVVVVRYAVVGNETYIDRRAIGRLHGDVVGTRHRLRSPEIGQVFADLAAIGDAIVELLLPGRLYLAQVGHGNRDDRDFFQHERPRWIGSGSHHNE